MSISAGACQKFEIFVQRCSFLNNSKYFSHTRYDLMLVLLWSVRLDESDKVSARIFTQGYSET